MLLCLLSNLFSAVLANCNGKFSELGESRRAESLLEWNDLQSALHLTQNSTVFDDVMDADKNRPKKSSVRDVSCGEKNV